MTRRILQIVQHLAPGGIETMALDLQRHLAGSHVFIASLEGDYESASKGWPRLKDQKEALYFLNKKPGFQLSCLWDLCRLIRALKIEAVHTHHIGPLTYGAMAARLCGVNVLVHTEHDAWHLDQPKAARLERRLIRWFKPKLVADCQLVGEKLHHTIGNAFPMVIYNGIDLARFREPAALEKQTARTSLKLPHQKRLIGCAARLEKVKGLSFLIKALSDLPKEVYLVLAGDGSERRALEKQARTLGCSERVIFLGRLSDMRNFYQAIDLFCLPSLNEGFPLSPLEAQACNVPVVITDVGGTREALCPESGHLVPPGDPVALKEGLLCALQRQRHKSPRPFVQARSDVHQMCAAYAQIFA